MPAEAVAFSGAVQAFAFPPHLRLSRGHGRLIVARAVGIAGVAAYNWWVVVPFVPGLMPSVNGFFSDLEAVGRPHATVMSDADLAGGALILIALLLRGSSAEGGRRREWMWLLAFAVAGVIGGRYPYACSEGLSESCRHLEWQFRLPVHHYVHMLSGIVEFAAVTIAAVMAVRRTRGQRSSQARAFTSILVVLALAYPFLGLAYLTDRLGTLVEPVFFLAFSAMILTELFEPIRRSPVIPARIGAASRLAR